MAKALALSLDLNFCTAQKVVVTDSDDPELKRLYDVVLPPPEGYKHWFIKLCALDNTDFDRILFIDGDSLAIRPIEPILEACRGKDFAVQGTWLSEVQWYGDMTSVMKRRGLKKIPKFSGGFLYYERTDAARKLIARIMELAADYDSLGLERNCGHAVDEVCISLAMAETGLGHVFPDSMQFSRTPYLLKSKVRLNVLHGECSFVKGDDPARSIRPFIYHSGHAGYDLKYWREVRRLMRVSGRRLGRTSGTGDRLTYARRAKIVLTSIIHRNARKY